jgi:ethanolaminephosphotransferase
MFNLVPCLLLHYLYGYDNEEAISSWMCHTIGVTYMIYIILDSLDGKQARNTGSSSALGHLFDHGCDAFTAVINSSMLSKMFCIAPTPYHLLTFMVAVFPFYFVTLESYYTGEMNFPPINGVDEGSVAILLIAIYTGM